MIQENATLTVDPDNEERFTFTSKGTIEFSNVVPPEGWAYNAEDGTLTTTASYYVPIELSAPEEEVIVEDIEVGTTVEDPTTEAQAAVETANKELDPLKI